MDLEEPSTTEVWRRSTALLSQDPELELNTFQEACGKWAADRSKLALVVRHEDGSSERWTYHDLAREAARAARLFADVGLRPGDRVAAVLTRQVEAWICALAAWRSGLVYVPLFVGFGGDALAARLSTSHARAVVVDHRWRAPLADAQDQLDEDIEVIAVGGPRGAGIRRGDRSFWAEMELCDADGPVVRTSRDTPATLMFTSGTTSQPKACVIPHSGFVALLPFVEHVFAVDHRDLLFSTSDPGWSYGLYTTGCTPMSMGVPRLIYTGDFDPKAWLRVMEEEQVTFAAGAPTAFRKLLAAARRSGFPSALRGASTAGEPLDPETAQGWHELSGTRLRDGYGLTEMGMVLGDIAEPEVHTEPGTLAAAVPGFEVCLVDEKGEPTDADEGRIAIRRPPFQLSAGYENASEAWDQRWVGDWYVTDDIAQRNEHGNWRFAGRADDVIVTSGYNVGPVEVESILLENPGVAEAAVVAAPDPERGSVIRAVIVRSDGASAPDVLVPQLQDAVRRRLGRHAYPRIVEFLDSLPRTATGKLRRAELRTTPVGRLEER
ncbi:MAG: AMP-binding protein [Propionibacteriales bacterium]|nr:AMP-binding protein [Propionibacteriales bacterium]